MINSFVIKDRYNDSNIEGACSKLNCCKKVNNNGKYPENYFMEDNNFGEITDIKSCVIKDEQMLFWVTVYISIEKMFYDLEIECDFSVQLSLTQEDLIDILETPEEVNQLLAGDSDLLYSSFTSEIELVLQQILIQNHYISKTALLFLDYKTYTF